MAKTNFKCPYLKHTSISVTQKGTQEQDETFKDCIREQCVAFMKIGNMASCNVGNSRWPEDEVID